MSKVLIECRGEVTLLTLNRPDQHNNVDADTACGLADAIDAFGAEAAKVLVITGAGDTTLCAGANLKGMQALFEHRRPHDAGPMGFARLVEARICHTPSYAAEAMAGMARFAAGERPTPPRPVEARRKER